LRQFEIATEEASVPAALTCPAAATLAVVGERWSLLVLRELFFGTHRFDQIARNTGAPRNILTTRLRHLEAAGVLERRRYQDAPARYDYHLTPSGRELLPVLLALMDWGNRHAVEQPRLMRHSCGADLRAVTICADCGEPAEAVDVSAPWRRTAAAAGQP
jgi:DNA-binding HxlR family transcriptional regulator